ncbi:MAG: hypothetical protein KDG55_23395, partial [Rhodocyclaceae bacterium]|nr:hypothetical protein [Rhodocyclaceae bacterium]
IRPDRGHAAFPRRHLGKLQALTQEGLRDRIAPSRGWNGDCVGLSHLARQVGPHRVIHMERQP